MSTSTLMTDAQHHDVDMMAGKLDFELISDSSLSETGTELASLQSSALEVYHENGRSYHAPSAGKYLLPNDEREVARLNLQHHLFRLTLDGRLCLSPKIDGARRVLDLGTGSGIWAIEFADAHPHAEVIGVDLSPVQPTSVPPNCSFEIDDIEKDWTWPHAFDFIFSRTMSGSFSDPASIVQKVYDHLEPGGYFEAQDMASHLGCDDGTLSPDSHLCVWLSWLNRGMEAAGRSLTAAHQWKPLMEATGFQDVVEVVYKWPINPWPRDPKYKELGAAARCNLNQLLEPALLAPMTRVLGRSFDETLGVVELAREVLADPKVHAYWPM